MPSIKETKATLTTIKHIKGYKISQEIPLQIDFDFNKFYIFLYKWVYTYLSIVKIDYRFTR